MVFSIDVRRSPSETALESDQLDQSRPLRPAITRAIVVGDCVRRAVVAHSDGHPTFVGRMEGKPRTGHGHAFFLPADDDGDGRLDRIVICARDGFDERALGAVERLHREPVWGYGVPDLRLPFNAREK